MERIAKNWMDYGKEMFENWHKHKSKLVMFLKGLAIMIAISIVSRLLKMAYNKTSVDTDQYQ